jgi:hypothetical protein
MLPTPLHRSRKSLLKKFAKREFSVKYTTIYRMLTVTSAWNNSIKMFGLGETA